MLDYEKVRKVPTIPELINVLEMADRKNGKEEKQRDYPERDFFKGYLLPLWSRWPLEEELQGLLGVEEQGGM